MLFYGEPFQENLLGSSVEALRKLGNKFSYYENNHYDFSELVEGVKENYHAVVEAYTYLYFIQDDHEIMDTTYIMKEQVNSKE